METKAGQLARLPDGQLVKIETVHEDGYATVRRIDGEWDGTIAVCKVSQLEPLPENIDSLSDR
jgi:hypothetical protein